MSNPIDHSTDGEISSRDAMTINPLFLELLRLLENPLSSTDEIIDQLLPLITSHTDLVRSFVDPATSLSIPFYVARRLSNAPVITEDLTEGTISLFRILIDEARVDLNESDKVMSQNIFFYVAKSGALECCKFLQSKGCASNLTDVHNQTPLFYAAREGRYNVVEWLVREGGCNINHVDRNGQTALFYAAREDRLECVMNMINSLGADPLIRDIYKKRARGYLKAPTQKRTFDYLMEVEKQRDPATNSSHRKLYIVRDEPVGAAAMTLRQHRPFNPYQKEEDDITTFAPMPAKRQRSGASTPATNPKPVKEKSEAPSRQPRSERSSIAPSPIQSPSEVSLPVGRSRFRVKAPLGKGGLDAFEQEFPQFALWGPNQSPQPSSQPPTPPKALNRPARAPPVGATPPWVSVASLLLRGPLWRYGPALIFHKSVLQLPSNLGSKYEEESASLPEKKLSIDLSVVRKKLEKGKYPRMTDLDNDIRSMFEQAYELAGGPRTNLGILTKATEIYYNQQLAGCGLAGIIRQEAQEPYKPPETQSGDSLVDSAMLQ